LRGMGKTVLSMIISIICVVGIRIVWIFTVFASLKTLETLFISYAISWIAAISILIVAYIIIRKRIQNKKRV